MQKKKKVGRLTVQLKAYKTRTIKAEWNRPKAGPSARRSHIFGGLILVEFAEAVPRGRDGLRPSGAGTIGRLDAKPWMNPARPYLAPRAHTKRKRQPSKQTLGPNVRTRTVKLKEETKLKISVALG